MNTDNELLEKRIELLSKKIDQVASITSPFYTDRESVSRDVKIDLRELWGVIWRGKWVIIVAAFVFAIAAVLYALFLPNIYKSEALLVPAEENTGGGLAGMAGQLGGLASLAGVNLGSGGNNKTTLAIEVLKSREFISYFIEKHDLLVPLMAAIGWNGGRHELIIDLDVYDARTSKWVRNVPFPREPKPSMQEAYREFVELFNVSHDKQTNFVLIDIEFFSPSIAKQWVDWIVEDINLVMKERDVTEAERSIEYLTGQLEKTSITDMQSVFYELIEEQTKTVMFAEVRDEYVFKTIDEAVSAELKTKPRRVLIVILGIVLGVMLGVSSVFALYFIKKEEL